MAFTRNDDHPYNACPDGEDCPRFPCRVYREGRRDGYDGGITPGWNGMAVGYGGITAPDGYPIGYADGYAAGSAAGYAAGYAAGCADGAASAAA